MGKVINSLLLLTFSIGLIAQTNNEKIPVIFDLDSIFLFIDNSPRNWYSLEIESDTLFQITDNIYFCNDKTMQIGSVQFDNGKPGGVKGSKEDEESALKWHKKWELDYQKKSFRKRLRNGEEWYYSKNDKPFLIWWFESPKKTNTIEVAIEVTIPTNDFKFSEDSAAIELNATHQLFLDFAVHGNTSVSISIPVLENETLSREIEFMKELANSLNVYGGPIDLEVLTNKLDKPNDYFFRDSLNKVKIPIPTWLNVIRNPFGKNVLMGSCPEKDNIYNSIGLSIRYQWDTLAHKNFSYRDTSLMSNERDDFMVLADSENEWRYFYTSDNSYFHCENIYLRKNDLYFYINFTATESTYEYNRNRLNEFVSIILNE